MRLAVFGASGRTGQELVKQALERGYGVAALARNPAKLDIQDARLRVVKGDVQDPVCVEQVIAGTDAVISVLGPTHNKPAFEVSRGMEHILGAMQKQGVYRLVISAGAGVGDPQDRPGLFDRLIQALLRRTARYLYEDMRRAVALVRASDRDWTVVRAPMLVDGPGGGRVRVGYLGQGVGVRLKRADLARVLLDEVESKAHVRQAPVVSN